jgi:hypothetical protein
VGGVSLGHLANAARAFVNSKLAALGRSFLRSWQTAGKEEKAPSMSYQHGEELDLALVQASTSLTATRYVHRRYQLNFWN